MFNFKVPICGFILIITIFCFVFKLNSSINLQKEQKTKPETKQPNNPEINEYIFGYQSYEEIFKTLKDWESKAQDLVEVESYGKTTNQKDTYYIKISNENNPGSKKILITACTHGNEPWSTSTVMAYAGMLLSGYGKDEIITKLINEKTIYIIPVVSPDSYPNSRYVDDVDPNRNFPTLKDPDKTSVPPIKNLQDFFLKIKPDSVLSGHTYGRVFLIPWGDSTKDNPNLSEYEKIAKKMCDLSGYRYQRVCEMYGRPIQGTEIDWYHRNGAFAMVIEFGSHQRRPISQETQKEFEKTKDAFLFFLEKSVEIDVKQ